MAEVIDPVAIERSKSQTMRALATRPLTVDEFLHHYTGIEGRWELVHGVPVMMAGGTIQHGRIARNIMVALGNKLRGSGCQPFGSDVGVQVDLRQYRQPDVSVLCDPRDIEVDEVQRAHFPKVLFEVFSPSTEEVDRGTKLREYRRIPSVRIIVHIDPTTQVIELFERVGPSEWRERLVGPTEPLEISSIGTTLTHEDIFRRD